jgi:hypothetical protein
MSNHQQPDVNELTQLMPFDADVHKNHSKFASGNLFVKTHVLESATPLQPLNDEVAEVVSENQSASNT